MAKRKPTTQSATNATLTDVIHYFIESVVKTFNVDGEMEAKRINDIVRGMQDNGADDDEIYTALGCIEPYCCDPMHLFEMALLESDEDCEEALKSQKKARREAALAATRANTELSNRLKCLKAEREARQQQTVQLDKLTTAKSARPGSMNYEVRVGCYVTVAPDLSPGKCSHGDKGFVVAIATDGTYAVEYSPNYGGHTESGIMLRRLTEIQYSAMLAAKRPTRERAKRVPLGSLSTNTQPARAPPPKRSLLDDLEYGLKRRAKGRRARDLGFDDTKFKDRSLRFKERVLRDLAVLSHATDGMSRCSRTIRSSVSGRFEQRKPYRDLSADIEGVFSTTTIFRYEKSWGLKQYTQRPLPHCGEPQKRRQVAFAKHFLNRWGLPEQPILLIHFDEKWFDSGKRRTNAKYCDEQGVRKKQRFMKHCKHPPKLMVVTVVAYAFDGGHGLKIGQYRCQKAKIALKDQYEATRDSNGKISYNGPLVRKKGDAYMVDCNVTGSGTGTASEPKFALMDLFKSTIFPAIAQLVGPGGPYEGYLPIFQGDNAGPHEDGTFKTYAADGCEKRSWKWEPQAPQMPHMNVLDLVVFPSLSKAHTKLCQNSSNKALPVKLVWDMCQSVFNALDSATIAKGFVSAFRMARKVVQHGGGNEWVRTEESHLNVRKDFKETAKGIVRKTK